MFLFLRMEPFEVSLSIFMSRTPGWGTAICWGEAVQREAWGLILQEEHKFLALLKDRYFGSAGQNPGNRRTE